MYLCGFLSITDRYLHVGLYVSSAVLQSVQFHMLLDCAQLVNQLLLSRLEFVLSFSDYNFIKKTFCYEKRLVLLFSRGWITTMS